MPTVILYWAPGRTQQQKETVVREMTDTLVEHAGARREDVLIIFQEIDPGNSARGGTILTPPVFEKKFNAQQRVAAEIEALADGAIWSAVDRDRPTAPPASYSLRGQASR